MKIIVVVLIALHMAGCHSVTLIDKRRPSTVAPTSVSDLGGMYSEAGLLYRRIYQKPVITNMTPDFPAWNEYGSPNMGFFTLEASGDAVTIEGSDGSKVSLPREIGSDVRDPSPILKVSRFEVRGEGVSGYGSGTAKLLKGIDGSIVIEYDILFELRSLFMPYKEREVFWAIYEKKK